MFAAIAGSTAAGFAVAVLAAACYETGYALQAIEAKRSPGEQALKFSLLKTLARRPRWVFAVALTIAGWPLQRHYFERRYVHADLPGDAVLRDRRSRLHARALGQRARLGVGADPVRTMNSDVDAITETGPEATLTVILGDQQMAGAVELMSVVAMVGNVCETVPVVPGCGVQIRSVTASRPFVSSEPPSVVSAVTRIAPSPDWRMTSVTKSSEMMPLSGLSRI